MAKITANGAHEVRRWAVGARGFVLCSDGRLLTKFGLDGYTVHTRNCDEQRAEAIVEHYRAMADESSHVPKYDMGQLRRELGR